MVDCVAQLAWNIEPPVELLDAGEHAGQVDDERPDLLDQRPDREGQRLPHDDDGDHVHDEDRYPAGQTYPAQPLDRGIEEVHEHEPDDERAQSLPTEIEHEADDDRRRDEEADAWRGRPQARLGRGSRLRRATLLARRRPALGGVAHGAAD